MIYCPFCNGRVMEIDKFGTETECELCGTTYSILPMKRNGEDESDK